VFLLHCFFRPGRRPVPAAVQRARLCGPEPLEDRTLPSGISFAFTLSDSNHEFDAYPYLMTDLQAAGQILSSVLDGKGTLQVLVQADDAIPRAGGYAAAVKVVGTQGGCTVVETGTLAEAQTGLPSNGSGPDAIIDLNASSYLPQLWFDPSGALRAGTVPANQTDFVSVIIHELTHSLGFDGYRTITGSGYGTISGGYETSFDALSSFGTGSNAGILFFHGSNAEAAYGNQPVPLTSVGPDSYLASENFYHFGNPSGQPGSELIPDLMNGVEFDPGKQYSPSALDLAALSDLGWSVLSPAVQFSTTAYTVSSTGSTATITVQRLGRSDIPFTVQYRTAAGTAQSGTDYTDVAGTLTFAAGQVFQTFTVPIQPQQMAGDRTVNLILSNANGVPLGSQSNAVLTITGTAAPTVVQPPPVASAPAPVTGDVTGVVLAFWSRPQFNRQTHRYQQQLILINMSGSIIQGPLYLLLIVPGSGQNNQTPQEVRLEVIPVDLLGPGQGLAWLLTDSSLAAKSGYVLQGVLAGG
jgi:hypothetical protein